MSEEQNEATIDLVRWTFTINPEFRTAIEDHLTDLGLDVVVYDDVKFVVTWDEPNRVVEEVVEEIWEIQGEAFEVTQEAFHRVGLHTLYHHDEQDSSQAA